MSGTESGFSLLPAPDRSREGLLQIRQQCAVDRVAELGNAAGAVVPVRGPQDEGGIGIRDGKEPNLAHIALDIALRYGSWPVIDAVTNGMLDVVQGEQSFVKCIIQDAFCTDLRALFGTHLGRLRDHIWTPREIVEIAHARPDLFD